MNRIIALTLIRKLPNISVKVTDGEFRITRSDVNRAKQEAIAYYTDDPQDALDTAKVISAKFF